jgi:hypothetical protein
VTSEELSGPLLWDLVSVTLTSPSKVGALQYTIGDEDLST